MSQGTLSTDLLHIPARKAPASVMVSARKIIQPNTARVKVRSIWAASRKEGSSFALAVPLLTIPLWSSFVEGKVTVATVSR